MKTKYILLGLMMTMALSLSARVYTKGEAVFLDTQMQDEVGDWTKDGANIYLYFKQANNDSNHEWVTMTPIYNGSKIYKGFLTANPNGYDGICWFDVVIVVRGSAPNWDSKYNQTCDIAIPDGNDNERRFNYLHVNSCSWNDNKWQWYIYSPAQEAISSIAFKETAEEIHVCPNALGYPIALRPKLDKTNYVYLYDDVEAQEWYRSEDGGNSWVAMDDKAGYPRYEEDEDYKRKDLFTTLPATISRQGVYYYLFSTLSAGRRLVHFQADAPKCELDCEITTFETAISQVNADDSTFTLDGMVAFGEAEGKRLVITCDDKSMTVESPQSPYCFSLHGVKAVTENGVKYTARAYFEGENGCSQETTIDVPNVRESIKPTYLDKLTGNDFTLTPKDFDPDNEYLWFANGDTIHNAPQVFVTPVFNRDTSITYTYKEFNPITGTMDNLITNGNYEASDGYGVPGQSSTMSDYDFWGCFPQTKDRQIDFYNNQELNPYGFSSNGFAVVQNANNFHDLYAYLTAREGNSFALFDGDTEHRKDNTMAWYAATSEGNPDLKLKKGTTYVLSFWAANINNYCEMDNPARFVFRIETARGELIGESRELDLSDPKFLNNVWHQCSETFLAEDDYDDIVISVVNRNDRQLAIGNDFALDDIQFRAISTVSQVVKSQQQFVVTAHEPKILSFEPIAQPVACGENTYVITMSAMYENPNGKLMIRDVTRDTIYEYELPDADFDTPVEFRESILIKTKEPEHEWEIYFENWPTAQMTATTIIPGFPSMILTDTVYSDPGRECDSTTTLSFHLSYTYQQGMLHYSVSGLEEDSVRVITTDKEPQELDLVYEGIPADGKAHDLRVWFDGDNSCDSTYYLSRTPIAPVIDTVIISGVPEMVSCSTTEYPIDVTVTTHFDATGEQIVLTYESNVGEVVTSDPITINGKIANATIYVSHIDNNVHNVSASFFNYPDCSKESEEGYTAPRVAQIKDFDVNVSRTACKDNKYSISGEIEFDMPDGDLIVWYDEEHQVTITNPTDNKASFQIDEMTAEGEELTIRAWFSESPNEECQKISNVFASPVVPTMILTDTVYSDPGRECDSTTTLSFHLSYTNQPGDLHYSLSGLNEDSVRTITTDKEPQELDLVYEGIPADGKAHDLHIWFEGEGGCDETYYLSNAPFSPVIYSVEAYTEQEILMCGEDSFDVHVTITMPYVDPTGQRSLELSFADSVVTIKNIEKTNELDLRLPIYDEPIVFTASMHTNCPMSSDPLVSPEFTPCEIYYDTICVGEPYNEHGFDIDNDLPVGTHHFYNAIGEELYLTVSDAKEMYSKWTDVLFIDNGKGQYVAFQWFKNGERMQGETLQRLYDPKGMAGTEDLYHCEMMMADGTIVTTCPQTFDQTQRSAEAPKSDTPAEVIRRYRVSPHVYIIQTRCGDRIETKKIFTDYE